jgi:cellulase (glycosyl hydrolase family 5)
VKTWSYIFASWVATLCLGLGLTTPAQATIAYVQSNASAPASASTMTVTYSSAQVAGDLNVVAIGWVDASSSVSSVTDSKGNTYVKALGPTVVSGTASQSIYYALNIAAATAGANTVTITFNATVPDPDVRILEYSGIATANALDVAVGGSSATGTALNSGSVTTTNANDLIIGSNVVAYGITATGSGYTQRILSAGNTEEDKTVTSTGSYSATATQSPTGWWIMQLTAFKSAGTPPNAPTALSATVASSSQINLSWTASTGGVGGATGYRIERCSGAGCSIFTQVGTSTTAGYADTGVSASTSYTYRVRASDTLGDLSSYSGTATATTGSGSTPIAYVQSNGSAPASASTMTVTYSSAQVAGDLNVVAVGWVNTTSSVSSVTDSKGNSYVRALGPTAASGTATESIYYAQNIAAAAAGANTVTVTFNTTVPDPDVRILEYSGIATANALDVAVGAGSTTGTALSSGPVTTINASDLLIGSNLVAYGITAAGSGYTQRDLSAGNTDEDKTVTSTGSYSATATQSPSGWWIMQLTAFKAAPVSASGTTIPSASFLIDSSYNKWTVSGGVIYENGNASVGTANVILLLYYNGVIYQENSSGGWWSWNGSGWTAISGDPRVSPSGTTIPPGSQITDSAGNVWTVSGGVVYENGSTAGYSASVSQLLYYNGVIYQENSSGGWWSWNGSTWVSVAGDPRSGGSSSAGVQVGSGGVLVDTTTGSTVNLTGMMVQGLNFGPIASGSGTTGDVWSSISAVTSAQWAAGIQQWTNTLTPAGKAYGTINTIRIALNSADWMAATGVDCCNNSGSAASSYRAIGTDSNGRTVYTASLTGGAVGTVGHEVPGDPTVYRNIVETTVSNILGASTTLGYPMYVILEEHNSAPTWTLTGQYLLPVDQPAMPAPIDILMLQSLAGIYGADHRVLIELYNEPFGTSEVAGNRPTESAYLGNNNGACAPNTVCTSFAFPTPSTSPAGQTCNGNNIGYNYRMGISSCNTAVGTAQMVSFQQEVNAYRTAGGNNVVILGNLIADEYPQGSPANGGAQATTDPYTVGGIQQLAWALHAYAYTGSTTAFTNIQNAGLAIIATESGTMTTGSITPSNPPGNPCYGSPGSPAAFACSGIGPSGQQGYTWWRSNNWSYIWCCWASFNNPPPTSIYPNGGNSYQYEFSISGENPWVEGNVPVGNNGTDTSQIPTGSN